MKTKYSNRCRKRVVITGLGAITPTGIGLESFWRNIVAGKSGIRKINCFSPDQFGSRVAGQVVDFNPREHGLRENQILRLDRYAQFALAGAKMALQNAHLDPKSFDADRIGVSIANAIAGTKYMEEEFLRLTENGTCALDPTWAGKALYQAFTFNVASAEVATEHGCFGPCVTTPTGCAAGLDAVGFGLDCIRHGDADIMITGASEAPLTPITLAAFDVVGALSKKRNDAPEQASRPFDQDRDGFVIAEGCGVLILEEREFAIRRGAPILAEVRGFGSSCNAYHMTDLHPDGKALARALDIAAQDGGIAPGEIDYVSAHGSSTKQNDLSETNAYKRFMGDHAYNVPISSLKSMCGHALSAANAIACVATVLSMQNNMIHPTINYEFPDPDCDLNYVPNEAIKADIDVAMKVASGFSGIHSAVIFSQPDYEGGRTA